MDPLSLKTGNAITQKHKLLELLKTTSGENNLSLIDSKEENMKNLARSTDSLGKQEELIQTISSAIQGMGAFIEKGISKEKLTEL